MYKTRKNSGVAWDDNVHSLRGLEDLLTQKKNETTRRSKRMEHRAAVLKEQKRLKSGAGQKELAAAAASINKSPEVLQSELLRGVSCSLSKGDKHRALALAMRDERASSCSRQGSARRLMKKMRSKLNIWASTSNRSMTSATSVSSTGESTRNLMEGAADK